ncbi:MYND-type domain-containing protein [Favolaschia claudopus]|uniref:MYND-type domain-containing protein n=1 Tax=Favolaschia claudopus TaxID=2862362 RepID=A0AAW0AYK6_9AGAR
MHPSLDPEHLQRLPILTRSRAIAAMNGSHAALSAVSRTPIIGLLPVYYALLDPSAILFLVAQMDSDTNNWVSPVINKASQIALCVQGIIASASQTDIPGPPLRDLWQRIWPWLEFMNDYAEVFSERMQLRLQVSVTLSLISLFGMDETTSELMRNTSGFYIVLFRLWTQAFDEAASNSGQALEVLWPCIAHVRPNTTGDREFEEAVEGSGGSRKALAVLCLKHIKHVLQLWDSTSTTLDRLISVRCVFALLQQRCETDHSFMKIVVGEGIIGVATSVACRLSLPPFTGAQDYIFNMSWYIRFYIEYGHNLATESLRSGLLVALLQLGQMTPPKPHSGQQMDYLLIYLSFNTVYFSFLAQFRASVAALDIKIDSNTFNGFPISDKWNALFSLLERRWAVMDRYLNRERERDLLVCGNGKCSRIVRRHALRHCSACKVFWYCSKECQIQHWQHGGHRQTCKWKWNSHGKTGRQFKTSKRDVSFLRSLIHEDYLRMKTRILEAEVAYVRANPGSVYYVKFDYCLPLGDCEISVEPSSEFPLDNDMWRQLSQCVEESNGRLMMHVLCVHDGGRIQLYTFPICFETEERRNRVEALAAATDSLDSEGPGKESYFLRLRELVGMDLLEVHC